jgi:uncharacterized membrane protein YkvA (DUF1232 family)
VEESEADLERFDEWLAKIASRDYFHAEGGEAARQAVEECRAALAAFEDTAPWPPRPARQLSVNPPMPRTQYGTCPSPRGCARRTEKDEDVRRMWWNLLIGIGVGLLAAWLALLIALLLIRPKGTLLGEAVRLLPDLLRLLKRLATDEELPRGVRVRLALLMVYLASPIDLIPDFLPVIGYADDAIIVAFVLRSVVRRSGIEAVRAHWPGSDDGFAALSRLTGLTRTGTSA